MQGNKVRGNGLDHGRYYECWNCHFICDMDRDVLGGSADIAGDEHIDYAVHAYDDYSTSGPSLGEDSALGRLCSLGGDISHFHVAMRNDQEGNPVDPYHRHKSNVSAGCPICGTKNWRGDY